MLFSRSKGESLGCLDKGAMAWRQNLVSGTLHSVLGLYENEWE